MTLFEEVVNKNFEKLELFTTAITRAHGKNHPEAFEVMELFNTMKEKIQTSDGAKPGLGREFKQLREVTDQYTIPDDVCETYASVYNMMSELDRAYQM